jgi:hypothetical protein
MERAECVTETSIEALRHENEALRREIEVFVREQGSNDGRDLGVYFSDISNRANESELTIYRSFKYAFVCYLIGRYLLLWLLSPEQITEIFQFIGF